MRKRILQSTAALCFAVGVMSANAATSVPDYQDWWWNPAQSGMGVNVGQQNDTLVVAWYHFDTDGAGTYLMLSGKIQNGRLGGDLIRTQGPVPGAGFNPAEVRRNVVGTANIVFSSLNEAVLNYQFDNKTGSIELKRYTFQSLGPQRSAMMVGTVLLDKSESCEEPKPVAPDDPLWDFKGASRLVTMMKVHVRKTATGKYALKLHMPNGIFICSETGDLGQTGGILSGSVDLECYSDMVITIVPSNLVDGVGKLNVKNLRIDGMNTQFDFEMLPVGQGAYSGALFCPRVGAFRGFEVVNE